MKKKVFIPRAKHTASLQQATSTPKATASSSVCPQPKTRVSVLSMLVSASGSTTAVKLEDKVKDGTIGSTSASVTQQIQTGIQTGKASVQTWWSCPRCDCVISRALTPRKRANKKWAHIESHGLKVRALTGNYKSRSQMYRAIWDGKVKKSPGGLQKCNLIQTPRGRIVSKARSKHSKKVCKVNGWADHWRRWCKSTADMYQDRQGGSVLVFGLKRTGTNEQRTLYLKVLQRWGQWRAPKSEQVKKECSTRPEVVMVPDVID